MHRSPSSTARLALCAIALAAATGAHASDATAPGGCAIELRPLAERIAPGEPFVLQLASTCAAPVPGVAAELVLESSTGERPIGAHQGATLGDAPLSFRLEAAEPACFVARVRRGDEAASARACLEAAELEIPAAAPHTASRGGDPAAPGLAQCRVIGLATAPGPRFAQGEALALSASFVCPHAVPRVHVAVARAGRDDAGGTIASASGVALRKGRTVVSLAGGVFRAAPECLRVEAERAGQSIEAQTCVRAASLRLANPPAARAAAETTR